MSQFQQAGVVRQQRKARVPVHILLLIAPKYAGENGGHWGPQSQGAGLSPFPIRREIDDTDGGAGSRKALLQ